LSIGAIDPRIRARRIEVKRSEGRRRLRRLGVAAGAGAVVAGLVGVAMTPVLDVDRVAVAGAAHSGADAVAAATGIDLGAPMVTADLGAAAARVARLPWVQTVDVRRRWPGTVVVEVVERTPVAAVPAAGQSPSGSSSGAYGWTLLDAEGRQLAVEIAPAPEVVRVETEPRPPELGAVVADRARPVLAFAATVPPALAGRLVALRPGPNGGVRGTVALRDGSSARVDFGRPEQVQAKWVALLTVLDGVEPAGLTRIDVRVPSAPVLTRG